MTGESQREQYLTVAEAATWLRTTPYNVGRMLRSGRIRATKPFGTWLIPVTAIEELLDERSNQPAGRGACR